MRNRFPTVATLLHLALASEVLLQNKFSGEYYKILISAEKKISNEEMKKIYFDVKKLISVK